MDFKNLYIYVTVSSFSFILCFLSTFSCLFNPGLSRTLTVYLECKFLQITKAVPVLHLANRELFERKCSLNNKNTWEKNVSSLPL